METSGSWVRCYSDTTERICGFQGQVKFRGSGVLEGSSGAGVSFQAETGLV